MIKTEIEVVGQKFVDEPVYILVSKPKTLAAAIAAMVGRAIPRSIYAISHYNRVPLRWLKPDRQGALVPMV